MKATGEFSGKLQIRRRHRARDMTYWARRFLDKLMQIELTQLGIFIVSITSSFGSFHLLQSCGTLAIGLPQGEAEYDLDVPV